MNIEIRTAIPSDCKILSELCRKTFYETWKPVNTEEDLQKYMNEAFELKKLQEDIEANKINTFFIAFIDQVATGYLKLRRDRTYDEFKNQRVIEIERLYVLKEGQGKKIGKELMDECVKVAIAGNYKWIWLGVAVDNIKAINFYMKYGFNIFGEKIFKLGEALDTDYLMKKEIR